MCSRWFEIAQGSIVQCYWEKKMPCSDFTHTHPTCHFTAQTTLTRALLDLHKCPLTSMAQSNKQAQTLISVSLPTPTCSRCSRTAGDGSKGGIQSALYGVPCGRAPVLVKSAGPIALQVVGPKSACGGGGESSMWARATPGCFWFVHPPVLCSAPRNHGHTAPIIRSGWQYRNQPTPPTTENTTYEGQKLGTFACHLQ